jgi:fermentation-respiration switch protein FrsA (DUF1100 family)
MTRTDLTFSSGEGTCAAWLYTPDVDSEAPSARPIIVMAHGLGAVKEMRLDAFAERFAAAGYVCLVFDYRHFGASSGEPRQLLDIGRQLEDWRSAVAFARTVDGVDPDRVVVWGTSFGGGHVLVTAAADPRIAAAISQCPFTDGLASTLAIPPATIARVTALAVRDLVGSRLGRPPVMVPTYGPPGSSALMTAPDVVAGVEAIIPEGLEVPEDVAARFGLDIIRYFPGRQARRVRCPLHVAVCDPDTVAPTGRTLTHVSRAPRGEVTVYPAGHFDIYVGEAFERNVADQLAFLARHVPADA